MPSLHYLCEIWFYSKFKIDVTNLKRWCQKGLLPKFFWSEFLFFCTQNLRSYHHTHTGVYTNLIPTNILIKHLSLDNLEWTSRQKPGTLQIKITESRINYQWLIICDYLILVELLTGEVSPTLLALFSFLFLLP